jgi:hypothetical protein
MTETIHWRRVACFAALAVAGGITGGCGPRASDTAARAPGRGGALVWDVTLERAGPVRFGMTAREASSAAGVTAGNAAPADSACHYWVPPGAPTGLRLMLENGIVVRADADSTGPTILGTLGVGSPVESVVVTLGPSLQVSPHKYQWEQGWRYLSFSDDSTHRLVFEVDSHVVRSWRAGLLPAVEYVEGCS